MKAKLAGSALTTPVAVQVICPQKTDCQSAAADGDPTLQRYTQAKLKRGAPAIGAPREITKSNSACFISVRRDRRRYGRHHHRWIRRRHCYGLNRRN